MHDHPVTIRSANAGDAEALRRLAELDSARPLGGRALVADRDGVPIAALSLDTGAVIADPFEPTADAVHLLRLRRYQVLRQGGGVAHAWLWLRRLAPVTAR